MNPFWLVLIAALSTFSLSLIGAGLILLLKFKNETRRKNFFNFFSGAAVGIILAVAVFSLLLEAEGSWWVIVSGFVVGGLCVVILNKLIGENKTSFFSLAFANIPEGFSMGILIAASPNIATLFFVLGLGVLNISQGAITITMLKKNYSNKKAFWLTAASGSLETISAIIGFLLVAFVSAILPFMLALAAGALISVSAFGIVEEKSTRTNIGLIVGFSLILGLNLLY